jgi:hypothetical protein
VGSRGSDHERRAGDHRDAVGREDQDLDQPGRGRLLRPEVRICPARRDRPEWQCGTTQVDFNLPERFGAFYIDKDSEKKRPVMVHRAICGSMERFLGILLENYAGHLPLWFAPLQVVVATITSEADDYARDVVKKLKALGLVAEADLRNEKINYKVREHRPRQGAGHARLRQAGGGGGHRQHPPARLARPALDGARRSPGDAGCRGRAAGPAASRQS